MHNWEHFFIVFFVTILITTYECVSIFENIFIINPRFTFLPSLIKLSNQISGSAIKYADKKVDGLELTSEDENIKEEKKE